jgi:hypothetical protein
LRILQGTVSAVIIPWPPAEILFGELPPAGAQKAPAKQGD